MATDDPTSATETERSNTEPLRFGPGVPGVLRWTANLGHDTSLTFIAGYLEAFDNALDLGHRWSERVAADTSSAGSRQQRLRELLDHRIYIQSVRYKNPLDSLLPGLVSSLSE